MKYRISAAIRTVKKMLIADQAKNSASTCGATCEAASGKRGSSCSISGSPHGRLPALPPPQHDDQGHERDQRRARGQAQNVEHHGAVAADRRVVVIAVEEERVD